MARQKSTPLRTALSRMFPKAMLLRLARETGALRRLRKVNPVDLFWVLVLSFGSAGERTIADLRRSYERVTGKALSTSSFYNRFTPAFARFLRAVFTQGLEKLSRCTQSATAVLGEIRDVLCVDSTVIRLHDALASCWPGCRTNHTLAAMKLHTVINVRGVGLNALRSPRSESPTARPCGRASGSKDGFCCLTWATSATHCSTP